MSDKHQILKGIGKGLGQLGVETIEKIREESGRILESTITGKQLLGLDRTMSDSELAYQKQKDKETREEEIKKLKGEMGQDGKSSEKLSEKRRNVEDEMEELRNQKRKEEQEKEEYYEKVKQQKERERQQQEMEYNSLMMESTNPAKQKKSRGSALAHKKKSQPDQSQMSATQEFNKGGKID